MCTYIVRDRDRDKEAECKMVNMLILFTNVINCKFAYYKILQYTEKFNPIKKSIYAIKSSSCALYV